MTALRFLINEFLEDDHLHGAVADLRSEFLREPVVLAGVGKHDQHLAHQVNLGKGHAIHARDGLAGRRRIRPCLGLRPSRGGREK